MENFLKSLRSYLEQFADLDISTEEGKQELFLYAIDFIRDNIDDVEEASHLIELTQHIAREFPEDGDIEYFIEQFKEQSGLSESLTNINNMENSKILVYHLTKEVTEHNYEDGSIGNPKVTLDEKISIRSNLNDLLNKISEEYNLPLIKTNWHIKSGKEPFEFYLVYERLENSDGEEPSNKEMEDFKNGNINLFDAKYTFLIEPIREELTLKDISAAIGIGVNESINEDKRDLSKMIWLVQIETRSTGIHELKVDKKLSELSGQEIIDTLTVMGDEKPGTFKHIKTFKKDGLTIIKSKHKDSKNYYEYIIFGEGLFYDERDISKIVDVVMFLITNGLHFGDSFQPVWIFVEKTSPDKKVLSSAALMILNTDENLSELEPDEVLDLLSEAIGEDPGAFEYIETIEKDGLTIIKSQNMVTENYDYIVFGEGLTFGKKDLDKIVKIAKDVANVELQKESFEFLFDD